MAADDKTGITLLPGRDISCIVNGSIVRKELVLSLAIGDSRNICISFKLRLTLITHDWVEGFKVVLVNQYRIPVALFP